MRVCPSSILPGAFLPPQLDSLLRKVDRIEGKIDLTLNAVLGLANDKDKYPALFFLVPVPTPEKKSLGDWLQAPNLLLNDELMVVFVCARTLRRVQYGDDDGFKFTVPKAAVADVFSKAADFWGRFGPILKLSAAFLTTAVKATTGVGLADLVPAGVSDAVAHARDTAAFVSEYATSIGQLVDAGCAASGVERATLDTVKPAEGVEGIDTENREKLQKVAGPAFIAFGRFLDAMGFDRGKLDMEVAMVEDEMQWVARDPPSAPAPAPVAQSPEPETAAPPATAPAATSDVPNPMRDDDEQVDDTPTTGSFAGPDAPVSTKPKRCCVVA